MVHITGWTFANNVRSTPPFGRTRNGRSVSAFAEGGSLFCYWSRTTGIPVRRKSRTGPANHPYRLPGRTGRTRAGGNDNNVKGDPTYFHPRPAAMLWTIARSDLCSELARLQRRETKRPLVRGSELLPAPGSAHYAHRAVRIRPQEQVAQFMGDCKAQDLAGDAPAALLTSAIARP